MRNISAALTKDQFRNKRKTVTRRMGWLNLKPGERLQVVEKAQGLKKGERMVKICVIEVLRVKREHLCAMTYNSRYGLEEVIREGFPEMTPHQFVQFFCETHNCKRTDLITRIEFKYIV